MEKDPNVNVKDMEKDPNVNVKDMEKDPNVNVKDMEKDPNVVTELEVLRQRRLELETRLSDLQVNITVSLFMVEI